MRKKETQSLRGKEARHRTSGDKNRGRSRRSSQSGMRVHQQVKLITENKDEHPIKWRQVHHQKAAEKKE